MFCKQIAINITPVYEHVTAANKYSVQCSGGF